jgi:hypothetical protein
MINGVAAPAQPGFYANISFEQLGEIMLTKAVDCLRGNATATTSQMLWKSKHGRAYIQVEKTSFRVASTCKDTGGRRQKQRRGKKTLTTGSDFFAESREPSAKDKKPSAKSLPKARSVLGKAHGAVEERQS